MIHLLSLAFAGPGTMLVGVDQLPWTPPAGELEACWASSRVCAVRGATPEALSDQPGVRYAEWDRPMQLQGGPVVGGTNQCPDPHELASIEVQDVWDAGTWGVDAPVVAVQDAGFRTSHVDLLGRIAGGYDYGDDDPLPEVSQLAWVPAHGTFVAGIVAANADNVGRTGVAPSAELFLQKIADSNGALFFSYAIDAMDDLVAAHPEVGILNYSIAASNPPVAFDDAVQALGDADILLVAAAANCGYPNCFDADNDQYPIFPSSYPYDHVVSVASLRPDGSLDPYSHFGATSVELAAPGADVCSLDVDSDTDTTTSSGTSYATPVVAGTAALVREAFPRLTAAEVVEALCYGAEVTGATTGKVACGALSAPGATTLPVVDLLGSPDVTVDGSGTFTLGLDSRGAAHDAELVLVLPASLVTAPGGSRVTVAVPADATVDVDVVLEAVGTGSDTATWTLTLPSGEVLDGSFTVDAVEPTTPTPTGVDTGTDTVDDTGVDSAIDTATPTPPTATADTGGPPGTTPPTDTGTAGSADDEVGPLEGKHGDGGCGCSSGSGAGGLGLGLLALVLVRRRR